MAGLNHPFQGAAHRVQLRLPKCSQFPKKGSAGLCKRNLRISRFCGCDEGSLPHSVHFQGWGRNQNHTTRPTARLKECQQCSQLESMKTGSAAICANAICANATQDFLVLWMGSGQSHKQHFRGWGNRKPHTTTNCTSSKLSTGSSERPPRMARKGNHRFMGLHTDSFHVCQQCSQLKSMKTRIAAICKNAILGFPGSLDAIRAAPPKPCAGRAGNFKTARNDQSPRTQPAGGSDRLRPPRTPSSGRLPSPP